MSRFTVLNGDIAMTANSHPYRTLNDSAERADLAGWAVLRKENEQLRALVARLSKLVVSNVIAENNK